MRDRLDEYVVVIEGAAVPLRLTESPYLVTMRGARWPNSVVLERHHLGGVFGLAVWHLGVTAKEDT